MSLEYIREHYKVPAKLDMTVIAQGQRGTIVGSKGSYLEIKMEGKKNSLLFHPTDGIKYIKNILVDIDLLAKKYHWITLNKFLPGHTYPMSELMEEIGLIKGTPQGKPRGNTK